MRKSFGSDDGKEAVVDIMKITYLVSLTFTNRNLPRIGKERIPDTFPLPAEEYMKSYN